MHATHRIQDPEQLRAMAAPARQRIIAGMEALGVVSAPELARHLGRSTESLYFHLRKLVACGLVEDVGERRTRRRSERLYRLTAPKLRIAGDLADPDFRDALGDACRTILRATERDYCRALDSPHARLQGQARNLSLQHYHVHLTPGDRRRLVQMLEEMTTFLLERNDPDRGTLHALTAVLAPIASRTPPNQGYRDA
ncbi:MAG: helix-turn-helix domain-containing protein [Planctomycetota bacterium]